MDEILALQAQLAAVQEQDTAHRLNEDNCVDIVMKLVREGKLDALTTTSGAREFVTPRKLEEEIREEIASRGGRVTLEDLQPILNVDIVYIYRKVAEIAGADSSVRLLNDHEIITTWYLDGVADEANERVAESGSVMVADLAASFGLPVDLLTEAIEERRGSRIHAFLSGATLYTSTFVERQKARVRGAFSAVTRPVSVRETLQAFGMDERVGGDLLRQLLLEGAVAGTAKGDQFVPAVFSALQRQSADTFFAQNGFIAIDRARALLIDDPAAFLRERHPDAVALESCVVAGSVLAGLEAQVEDAVATGSWASVAATLPAALTAADVEHLLARCRGASGAWGGMLARSTGSAVAVAGGFVVSLKFLDGALGLFRDPAGEGTGWGEGVSLGARSRAHSPHPPRSPRAHTQRLLLPRPPRVGCQPCPARRPLRARTKGS